MLLLYGLFLQLQEMNLLIILSLHVFRQNSLKFMIVHHHTLKQGFFLEDLLTHHLEFGLTCPLRRLKHILSLFDQEIFILILLLYYVGLVITINIITTLGLFDLLHYPSILLPQQVVLQLQLGVLLLHHHETLLQLINHIHLIEEHILVSLLILQQLIILQLKL